MGDLDAGHRLAASDAEAGARSAAYRAVLRRTVEGELLPRLLLQHRAGPVPPGLLIRLGTVDEAEVDRFVALLRSPDEDAADRYLESQVRRGDTLVSLFQDVMTPAATRLGHLWEEDTCDFVEVTVACARLQRSVRRLGRLQGPPSVPGRRGRVLVCGVEGDQHTLGPILVAETLVREGFRVALGPPFGRDPLEAPPDLIAISVANSERWLETRARIVRLRRRYRGVRVILGGGAVVRHPEMAATAGADAWALDVEGLLDLVRTTGDA